MASKLGFSANTVTYHNVGMYYFFQHVEIIKDVIVCILTADKFLKSFSFSV